MVMAESLGARETSRDSGGSFGCGGVTVMSIGAREVWISVALVSVLNVSREIDGKISRRDDGRWKPVKERLAGLRDEVVMQTPNQVIEGHLPGLALPWIVSDLREHGVNCEGQGEADGLRVERVVDELSKDCLPATDPLEGMRGGRAGITLVQDIVMGVSPLA